MAWTGVLGATGGATAIGVLAPKWLNRTIGLVVPDEESDEE